MKLFSGSMLAAALLAGVSVCAEPVVYAKKADFKGTSRIFSDTAEGFQIKCGANKNYLNFSGNNPVPVEAGKTYKISCEYRLAAGCTESAPFRFYVDCLDKDKRSIVCQTINAMPDTLTELAAPVKAGDTVVKVKDAKNWLPTYGRIAFNAKEDNSDLPNFELSGRLAKDNPIVDNGECWVLTLGQPLTKEYPEGTLVRNHRDGVNFIPVEKKALTPTAEWQTVSKTFFGISEDGESNGSNFRTATAFILPYVAGGNKDAFNIEFRNFKIEEVAE